MNIETPFIVLSADRAEFGDEVNTMRRDTFEHLLRARGLHFKQVLGSYQGVQEVSYLVLTPVSADEDNAIKLARRYGQESVLYVDANRYATLITLHPGQGGSDIAGHNGLGLWRETTEAEATAGDAWTRSDDGRYFITKPLA